MESSPFFNSPILAACLAPIHFNCEFVRIRASVLINIMGDEGIAFCKPLWALGALKHACACISGQAAVAWSFVSTKTVRYFDVLVFCYSVMYIKKVR